MLLWSRQVAATFEVWKGAQDQLVGWFPRGHTTNSSCEHTYLLRDAAVLLRGRYSIILTKVLCTKRCAWLMPRRLQCRH